MARVSSEAEYETLNLIVLYPVNGDRLVNCRERREFIKEMPLELNIIKMH